MVIKQVDRFARPFQISGLFPKNRTIPTNSHFKSSIDDDLSISYPLEKKHEKKDWPPQAWLLLLSFLLLTQRMLEKEIRAMVFLYSSAGNDFFSALKHRLSGDMSSVRLESYTRLDELFHRLRQPRMNLEIGVFVIAEPAELERLRTVRESLTDMRLVLAVTDNDPQTLLKANALAPRFITFIDKGIFPLVSVVKRMIAVNDSTTFPNELNLSTDER